jgi:hypothetical protein
MGASTSAEVDEQCRLAIPHYVHIAGVAPDEEVGIGLGVNEL